MGNLVDLVGRKYGRLTVLKHIGSNKHSKRIWECSCECGNVVTVATSDLSTGNTTSCGCYGRSFHIKHGLSSHPMVGVWRDIKQRILNENNAAYKEYGGRGIKICDKWLDFKGFYEDMSSSWEDGLEINRIDPDGDYCKENCNWATKSEQGHFKRKKKGCSSEFYGVYYTTRDKRFVARITKDKEVESLGYFINELDAALAYDNRSEELYGNRPNKTVR